MSVKLNYSELDTNLVEMVMALNAFEGIKTIGSCGGHDNPGPGQWPKNTWYVKFEISRDDYGWFALEFLAWAINEALVNEHSILFPEAPPPYLNEPGKVLSFVIEGRDSNPDEIAMILNKWRKEFYISPELVVAHKEKLNDHAPVVN